MEREKYLKGLERNIYKNYALQITRKRVYLPLIAIYAVNVAGVSLYQLGVIGSMTAIISLLLEIPSGYISDRIGHKNALVLGNFIEMFSPIFYILFPNFSGVLLGSVLFFGGGAFISGTHTAFMHETFFELNRESEFTKFMGRAQSYGLLGNVLLIALVPLFYPIDVRIPFFIGFLILLINFLITLSLVAPMKTKKKVSELESISFTNLVKSLKSSPDYLLFIMLGVVTATANKAPDFREIYFQAINIPVIYFGFILSATSFVGALLSYNIHKLEFFERKYFYLMDFSFILVTLIIIGFTHNPLLGALLYILLTAYSRNRKTLINTYVLSSSPTRELKATYLSILAFFDALNGIWIPLLLGYLIGYYGVNQGYGLFGTILLFAVLILYIFYIKNYNGYQAKNNKISQNK